MRVEAASLGSVSEPSQDGPRAANYVLRCNGTKVSAVKACGCAAQKEVLARLENTAALPLWQGALSVVCLRGSCHKGTADKYIAPVPADPIAASTGNPLQKVGRERQIAPTRRQISGVVRQAHNREIASSWLLLLDPIEADRSTGRLVPDNQRVPLG